MNLSKYSGSGMFTPEALVSNRIAIGTGVLLSVPEVSGKVYKITVLTTNSSAEQAGMSLIIDGVTMFDEETLMDSTPTAGSMQALGASFGVASSYNTTNTITAARMIKEIYCTSFSLIKNSGNTAESIDYAYQVGSFK